MTPDKIVSVIEGCRQYLEGLGVEAERIEPHKTFGSCSDREVLAHARYLVDNFKNIDIERQYGKANRHLTAIQMCLSFAGEYTLLDLMNHNRPD
jgi:hypothetical protein